MEREDSSLLSYESSNSTSGMMLQSLGKPSALQEDDSIKVLAGRWRYESWGGPVYCVVLQCNGGFMKVLYCSILGKLDLG